MPAARLLRRLLVPLLTWHTSTAAALLPGELDVDLVFPLNDTYAPVDATLPIVFALSWHPFQPALTSTVDLQIHYLLTDTNDLAHNLGEGSFDLGELAANTIDNPFFFFNYSDPRLAGRESVFQLQIFVGYVAGLQSSTGSTTTVSNPNILLNAYFSTQSGAPAAELPVRNGTSSRCRPHASWSLKLDVSGYVEINSKSYAAMTPSSPSWGPRTCAVELDAAAAANITASASMSTATASTTVGIASSSSSAAARVKGYLFGSETVAAGWSLLLVGFSAMLFVW
ncbi:hypothetical protein SPI_04825 [Niveomyces insectorum RCEF 264]|uniref:DUF7136 domain-containing protein n=1 Tax=Niveomyces insectorum RCEF 264 TaxID=1081102 RepID=A0A167UW49_9HYPO|nr:hypothetical protein SPI_04825 [Niveomyces insectorum RCEF 264]